MSSLRPLLIPVLIASVLVVAGCSSPQAGAGSPQLPADAGDSGTIDSTATPSAAADELDIASLDACTILTREDAETLMSTPLSDPYQVATSDVSSCTYPGDPNGPTAQAEIYVGPGAEKQLEIERDTLGHEFTQPTGIGDEAWLESSELFARTGDTWISIRIITLDDPASFDARLQVAMLAAIERLA